MLLLPAPCSALDEPPCDGTHGGMMTVRTSLLFGSTTWLICWPPLDDEPLLDGACELWTPPGVTRTVLGGGGGGGLVAPPPELPPEELDDPPLEDWPGGEHGWTATVCVRAPTGTTIWLEPGGITALFCVAAACACEHGGMATVRSWRCFGMTSMRIPGVCIAIDTGSCWACCCLLPHDATDMAVAARAIGTTARLMSAPPRPPLFRLGLPRGDRGKRDGYAVAGVNP